MQPGLLALLVGLILLTAFCYWLGFRVRPRPAWAWRAQAGFLITSLVLIPIVGLTLYFQLTATARLRHFGVVPHPALSSSVGLAVGLGPTPTFLFHSRGPAASVMSFYRPDSTHPGWTLTEESGGSMVFQQGARRLTVMVQQNGNASAVTYQLWMARRP